MGPGALLPRLTHSGGAVLPSHHHPMGWGTLPAFIILREAAASSHPHHLTTLGARESSSSASPPALPNKALWGSGHCRAAYSMGQMGPSHTWMDAPPAPTHPQSHSAPPQRALTKLISVSCSSSSCSLSSEEGSGTDSPGELLGRQKGESCRATFQLEWSQSQHPAEHPMAGVRTELPAATPGHPTKPGEASTSCQSCYGAP